LPDDTAAYRLMGNRQKAADQAQQTLLRIYGK
jgi:DNA-directed RNA polymerase specialized sigma24 family protein